MSVSQQQSVLAHRQNGAIPAHRRLLSNIEGNADSGSDVDATTDEEVSSENVHHDGGNASRFLDVSMSHAQVYMRSPRTPAIEKAQALEESRNYFQVGDEFNSKPFDERIHPRSPEATDTSLTSWTPKSEKPKRYSITRIGKGDGQVDSSKRSSSGPYSFLDGFKKIFSDFSPNSSFGTSVKDESRENSFGTGGINSQCDTTAQDGQTKAPMRPSSPEKETSICGEAATSSTRYLQHSKPLRRSTSDHSLYLRRAVTGASTFDDITAFAKIADMPNSRFKAITDSLADTSFKMPKMPSISFSTSSSSLPKSNNGTTKSNRVRSHSLFSNSSTRDQAWQDKAGTVNHVTRSDTKHPVLTDALSQVRGDIVIMGGYRGSILRSAEPPHHQLWVPVKVGLNLRKVNLEVGLSHEDEERMEEKIIPSGILSHIGPIDIARRLLKKIRKCPNAKSDVLRVHDWGYDWRLSPHYLSEKLIKFLEGLECNQPGVRPEKRGALIVAHSLGGLITRHAVNQRPELFSGVVYAGAPQNCCNILGPLRNGDGVLLSSRVLTAQVNFTLRTSYALLPESGRCFLNKETGERYDVDFFDMDMWDEYRLSPCINPCLPANLQPRKSLVGSITESISSFTPSLPSKRTPWFSGLSSTPLTTSPTTSSSTSTSGTFKDTVENAGDQIGSVTKSTVEGARSPKREVQDSLEPSMAMMSHSPQQKSSIATAVTIPRDKAREYLARTLSEVKQFKSELNHLPAHQAANRYPPHAVLFGKSVPTVYGAKVTSREAIKYSDAYDDLAFAAGDGVVLASAAQLPSGYLCVKGGRIESERGHVGLLGDLEGIGKCIAAVVAGRQRGIGLGGNDK